MMITAAVICIVILAGLVIGLALYVQEVQQVLRAVGGKRAEKRRVVPRKMLKGLSAQAKEIREQEGRMSEDERDRELMETRMKFAQLQNQINPHFLYNTLENIRARAILDDNDVIADMTEALSRFFRYNISKRSDVVKLSEELDNIRTYMHIQQYRFSGKFDFQVYLHDEEPGVLDALIPKMTLQPIVENAIFHGMENKVGKGHIGIHVESDEQYVYVIVEDDGVGMPAGALEKLKASLDKKPDGTWDTGHGSDGIAMRNVNNRLKLFFGEACGITVSSTEGVGTEVELSLPKTAVSAAVPVQADGALPQ